MKLKERVVAATFGFSLAIVLILVLESFELTNHNHGEEVPNVQDPSHGVINPPSASKSSSFKAFKQRNLQKTDSSGNSGQLVNSALVEENQNQQPHQERLSDFVTKVCMWIRPHVQMQWNSSFLNKVGLKYCYDYQNLLRFITSSCGWP